MEEDFDQDDIQAIADAYDAREFVPYQCEIHSDETVTGLEPCPYAEEIGGVIDLVPNCRECQHERAMDI